MKLHDLIIHAYRVLDSSGPIAAAYVLGREWQQYVESENYSPESVQEANRIKDSLFELLEGRNAKVS